VVISHTGGICPAHRPGKMPTSGGRCELCFPCWGWGRPPICRLGSGGILWGSLL